MSKKIILFDIDYTLFNTDLFRDLTYPQLMKLLNQEDTPEYHAKVSEIEKELISNAGYEPVAFAKTLSQALQIEPKHDEIQNLFYDKTLYKKCLYAEVQEVLDTLSQRSEYVLGIVSKGEETFQKRKIEPILQYFSPKDIYISLNKFTMAKQVADIYLGQEVYVIDDSTPFLNALLQADSHIQTILVEKENRYEKRPTPEGFEPNFTIKNLKEVLFIVDKS